MENILTVIGGIQWLAGAVGVSVSVVYACWSGYLFMSAEGDPQRMAKARTSLIGVVIGLVIIGGAYFIPQTLSRHVVEPAGGVPLQVRVGADCDGFLRDQLVLQTGANAAPRMQYVIARLQGLRDECNPDMWSPVVKKSDGRPGGCADDGLVGTVAVPDGLRRDGAVRGTSGRDADNNIIVYWQAPAPGVEPAGLPSDGSICWLHAAAFGAWSVSYAP